MTLLSAQGLELRGRLRETDFRMDAPALVCVVGPNGSGKTSLLHALAGIGSPSGEVRIDGVDPSALGPDERRRLLAYLPASRDILWPLAGRDLIALGLPGNALSADVEEAARALELGDLLDRRVDRMSTGERSRVLIARALAAGSRLLLLDEPVANLDPYWQLRMMELLRSLARGREGQAVLVALHDLDLAGRYADRLLIMSDGRIAADGEPAALLAGAQLSSIFGIERSEGAWRPLNRPEDRRSLP
jgi:iron complex transport system ATP-binding protein